MPFTELALSRRNPLGSKWNGPRPHNRLRDPPETHASAGSPHRQPTSKSRTQLRWDPARTTDDLRCTLLRSGVGVVLSAVEARRPALGYQRTFLLSMVMTWILDLRT